VLAIWGYCSPADRCGCTVRHVARAAADLIDPEERGPHAPHSAGWPPPPRRRARTAAMFRRPRPHRSAGTPGRVCGPSATGTALPAVGPGIPTIQAIGTKPPTLHLAQERRGDPRPDSPATAARSTTKRALQPDRTLAKLVGNRDSAPACDSGISRQCAALPAGNVGHSGCAANRADRRGSRPGCR
jgi:hypothetical protein